MRFLWEQRGRDFAEHGGGQAQMLGFTPSFPLYRLGKGAKRRLAEVTQILWTQPVGP